MDRDTFLARCEEIEDGLEELSDDLCESLDQESEGPGRDELVKRAQEKISLYEMLWAELDNEEDKEDVEIDLGSYIECLQNDLKKIDLSIAQSKNTSRYYLLMQDDRIPELPSILSCPDNIDPLEWVKGTVMNDPGPLRFKLPPSSSNRRGQRIFRIPEAPTLIVIDELLRDSLNAYEPSRVILLPTERYKNPKVVYLAALFGSPKGSG